MSSLLPFVSLWAQAAQAPPKVPAWKFSLLTASEISATKIRIETLLDHRVHPYPPADWPAVPWPPV